MKNYAYIYIISLVILGCFGSCRSNRSLSDTRKETLLEQSKEQLQASEQSNSKSTTNVDQAVVGNSESNRQNVSTSSKDGESNEYKTEETKIEIYDKDGNLRATIRNKKQSGRTDKSTEQTRSSDSSNESCKDSTNTKTTHESETDLNKTVESAKESDTQVDVDEQISQTNSSDSRLIQGAEWIYVFVGSAIALIIIVCAIIYSIRKQKK